MNKTFEHTKNRRLRKITLSAIVGASILYGVACGGDDEKLPITPETRREIIRARDDRQDKIIHNSNVLISQAYSDFDQGIRDGYLSMEEQTKIYNSLDEAETSLKQIKKELYPAAKALKDSVSQGRFTNHLEDKLKKDGLDVKVEQPQNWEMIVTISLVLGLGYCVYRYT